MRSPGDGFLLIGPNHAPLYLNDDAVEILAYPNRPETIKSLESFLAGKIETILSGETPLPEAGFVTHVQSGRRRYLCRAYPLNGASNGSKSRSSTAILIERCGKCGVDTAAWGEKFHLTHREIETVAFLLQGLTNKEIASRMTISPNTVKAFIRLIMVKMGTSTRSGIIGRLLENAP